MNLRGRIFLNDNTRHEHQRGIARYFAKVAEALLEQFGPRIIVCSALDRDYRPARHLNPDRQRLLRLFLRRAAIRSWMARWTRPALVFSPNYGFIRTRAPQIFTIHDLIPERVPEKRDEAFIRERRACVDNGAALIAISQATARDLRAFYPQVRPEKIHVIYHGVDEFFFQRATPVAAQKPYFLYVGHRASYKNFLRLLVAFGRSGLAPACDLRVAGPVNDPFTAQEDAELDRYSLRQSVHLITNADEFQLRQLYAGAMAFVYPSELEGFGLPLLEAMASGTLVAAARTSVLPEVGGDAPFYFDPQDADAIASCLVEVARLPAGHRAERIARGVARARLFTWEQCQRQTVAVFLGLLGEAPLPVTSAAF